ncbi:sce7725 family protein [Brachybacterium squillarum]|uniref:sce7725 family protein n=1 Tax=Brachybacterium squillarum TaxID=661979 RepID=UPI0011123FD3|nr:sce7725 family protein [Brachybacterium squillarum]
MIKYYPVLRGKQYELIALRELAGFFQSSPCSIHPVIEPVRSRTSSRLRTTSIALNQSGIDHSIIFNPHVGDFQDDTQIGKYPVVEQLAESEINFGAILSSTEAIPRTLSDYRTCLESSESTLLLFERELGNSRELETFIEDSNNVALLLPPAVSAGRYRRFNRTATAVLLNDNFRPRSRNLDYVTDGPELFTSSHLYAELDGYEGVADYLTVGEGFNEGGFLPRVVAIHWTYLNDNGEVWIRHFTSGESSRAGDVPGKFLIAASKLVESLSDVDNNNPAARAMRDLVASSRFPGLGTVKKISMLNHMIVMNSAIAQAEQAD